MNPNIYTSSEEEVKDFLRQLRNILNSETFNIDKDLDILLKKKNESADDPFTTENTLLSLDFDREDIKDELLTLSINDYYETIIDDKSKTLPPFYAFSKQIKGKDVYIKVKIRDRINNKIFCVSFHYPRYPLHKNPYV